MGFFKELKRLFKGYDLTAGANFTPMNREQRRAEERRINKLSHHQKTNLKRRTS